MPKHVKVSCAREKVGKTMSTLKRSFATAIGIEDLCKTENTKLSDKQKENKKKAKDLDLMVQIKDKLSSFDYRTKIQILTLKPEILLQTFSDFLSTWYLEHARLKSTMAYQNGSKREHAINYSDWHSVWLLRERWTHKINAREKGLCQH